MERIIVSIKNDNLELFKQLIDKEVPKNISFGRFPLLTLLYLFNAKKILKLYEKELVTISDYIMVTEPVKLFLKFRAVAGKTIRIYVFNKKAIITPIEMLYIMQDNEGVEYLHKYFNSDEIHDRLIKIERIQTQRKLEVNKNRIQLFKPKMSIFNQAISIISIFVFVACIALSIWGIIILKNTGNNDQLYVINKKGFENAVKLNREEIILKKDITLDKQLTNLNSTLNGDGHTITVSNVAGPLFNGINGKIRNVNFVFNVSERINSDYYALFEENNGLLENVTIRINIVETSLKNNIYGICKTNNATIKDCTFDINYKISAYKLTESIVVAGITGTNKSEINNCTVNSEVYINGDGNKDIDYSPVCSTNEKDIINITTNNNIDVTYCDISGIVKDNTKDGVIDQCVVNGEFKQSTNKINWSPKVCGAVINNSGVVNSCRVYANLTLDAQNEDVEENKIGNLFLGGIISENNGLIQKSVFKGDLNVTAKNCMVIVGAISALDSASQTNNCIVEAKAQIDNASDSNTIVGGIVGYVDVTYMCINCFISLDVEHNLNNENKLYAGSLFGVIVDTFSIAQTFMGNNHFVINETIAFGIGNLTNQRTAIAYEKIEDMKEQEGYFE